MIIGKDHRTRCLLKDIDGENNQIVSKTTKWITFLECRKKGKLQASINLCLFILSYTNSIKMVVNQDSVVVVHQNKECNATMFFVHNFLDWVLRFVSNVFYCEFSNKWIGQTLWHNISPLQYSVYQNNILYNTAIRNR